MTINLGLYLLGCGLAFGLLWFIAPRIEIWILEKHRKRIDKIIGDRERP